MSIELLKQCVRLVDPEKDKDLPRFSHSKLEVYENCKTRYDLQYNQGKRTNDTSLALEIGTLCHKVLEEKGKMIVEQDSVDYDKLYDLLYNGCVETDEKTRETIRGVNDLKKTYFEEWYSADNASGMNYDEKLIKFNEVLHNEMQEDDWVPVYFELPFEFVWKDKYIISGFIDRIDKKGEEYRVCDYKTSKRIFDTKKLPTAQQMAIYGCAILAMFDKLPSEYLYRFILINESQKALTIGWIKRFIKKLDKVFDSIEESATTHVYAPSPSPLCFYCNYCCNNPNAKDFKNDCEYYSLWTPENKVFSVNKEFDPNKIEEKRKLVF